jgi:hypothetical protein
LAELDRGAHAARQKAAAVFAADPARARAFEEFLEAKRRAVHQEAQRALGVNSDAITTLGPNAITTLGPYRAARQMFFGRRSLGRALFARGQLVGFAALSGGLRFVSGIQYRTAAPSRK